MDAPISIFGTAIAEPPGGWPTVGVPAGWTAPADAPAYSGGDANSADFQALIDSFKPAAIVPPAPTTISIPGLVNSVKGGTTFDLLSPGAQTGLSNGNLGTPTAGTDLITNLLSGNNAASGLGGGNVTINTVTENKPVTNLSQVTNTVTNIATNSAQMVADIAKGIVDAFKGVASPIFADPNPATLGNVSGVPGGYASGRAVIPGQPGATDSTVASIGGESKAAAVASRLPILGIGVVLVLVLWLVLRRKK